MIPKVDRTTILAKVIHNSVVAVGCLHDFARRSGDFDLAVMFASLSLFQVRFQPDRQRLGADLYRNV